MLLLATILNGLAVVAIALAGLRYMTASVPMDYHVRIFEADGLTLSPATTLVLRTFYRGLGALFLATAVALLWLMTAVWQTDQIGTRLVLLAVGAGPAIVLAVLPRLVEQRTGVRTPWRLSAAVAGLLVLGFLIGVLG
ncbi:MAG: hypothetical protein AAFO86_03550 [Pseudomonadota bacterium]